jgi:hypothetical protein
MRVLFYFLYGAFGMLGGYFVLSSLLGRYVLAGAPALVAKLVLVAGAALGCTLLYWAYHLGEIQGRWGAGAGAVLLAVLGFQVVQLLGAVAWGVVTRLISSE